MQHVDIYIAAGIRGPARGTGRAMYLMRTRRRDGSAHESRPSVTESDNATEARLVLLALRDALQRMNYACSITVHTESTYIASAISNDWMEGWERGGWKNAKKKEVRDSILWSRIHHLTREAGHVLSAECGPHEFTRWMRWEMPHTDARKDEFTDVEEKPVSSVHDWVKGDPGIHIKNRELHRCGHRAGKEKTCLRDSGNLIPPRGSTRPR